MISLILFKFYAFYFGSAFSWLSFCVCLTTFLSCETIHQNILFCLLLAYFVELKIKL